MKPLKNEYGVKMSAFLHHGHHLSENAFCCCGRKLILAPPSCAPKHKAGDPVMTCEDCQHQDYYFSELIPGKQLDSTLNYSSGLYLELETGVWWTEGRGDPPRTVAPARAMQFTEFGDMQNRLAAARKFHDFPCAKAVAVIFPANKEPELPKGEVIKYFESVALCDLPGLVRDVTAIHAKRAAKNE